MTQNEFVDYCKKNKTVAFGVPIILLVLLLDSFVLKPARQRKLDEARGVTTKSAPEIPAVAGTSAAATSAKTPMAPAKPLDSVYYPPLSERVDSRFAAQQNYPYSSGRNVFNRITDKRIAVVAATEEQETDVERPDITYHGFFTVGNDRIAILRFADELLLTKVGGTLKRTPFFLRSVFPEKIIISDTTESIREFEVSLSDKPKD